MAREIMTDTKKIIVDYAIDLSGRLEQIRGVILDAQYRLEKKDYGAVSDKITTAETLIDFLFRDYPTGFKYLDDLIDSKGG